MKTTRRVFLGGLATAAAGCSLPRAGASTAVRFGFITDCHYAAHIVRPGDPRRYKLALAKMRDFARCANRCELDFVVEGGDFKDLGRTPAETLKYLDEMESAFAGFNGPRYHVLGNHDHDNISKEDFLAHIANAGQEQARAYYAFTCRGVKFIVLDACYRHDGQPYCRGNFNWKQARIPEEQIAFLRDELASATGPCVPIVHQQLDAEDETCIVNAAEVRTVLEASGKVKAVIQGHYHEGAFREVNGIGYYTLKANVIGEAGSTGGDWAIVQVATDGSVEIFGQGNALTVQSRPQGWDGKLATQWKPGHYQVHFIYTGRGESMFHIFPDGTSMLVDCGDSMRFHNTSAEVPLLPDLSRRSGEWIARYVERVNPRGRTVDVFHLSHYHEDHGGGERYHGERIAAPTGDYWRCGLADAARILSFRRIVDRSWPDFADPIDALATSRDGTPRNVRAVYADLAARCGTKIERFRLGARDQFAPGIPDFEVFNLCANGRFVQKDGAIRDLYADRVKAGAKMLNENGLSCGFVVRYGRFSFFSAGDFSDGYRKPDGTKGQTEDLLAEAVGPVCVAKMSHHGHHSMFPELVKALRARVWTCCVLDQQHVTDDTACRLADRSLYKGDRTILPTYMPLKRPETKYGRDYLPDVPQVVRDAPCHVVLDVPAGGETYTVSCLSAADESNRLMAQFGFFSGMGERTPEAAAVLRNLRAAPERGQFFYAWCHPWQENNPAYHLKTPNGPVPKTLDAEGLGKGFGGSNIGRTPCLYFSDFYFVTDSTKPVARVAESRASLTAMVRAAWKAYRSVPVFSWHAENPHMPKDWKHPSKGVAPYRYRYSCEGYPQEHRYVIAEILRGDTFARTWYDESLARIASFLGDLKDDEGRQIPAIIRLFHECEDDWQWWGRGSVSATDYRAIFRYTVERLRALTGGGRNLLFAYSPDRYWKTLGDATSSADFLYRYPGDDVVDLIGHDDYSLGASQKKELAEKELEHSIGQIRMVSDFAVSRGKAAGLFETGVKGARDDAYDYIFRAMTAPGAKYGFVCTWGGAYSRPETEEGRACWRKFAGRPEVLTVESGESLVK